MGYDDRVEFSDLIGKTLKSVNTDDDRIVFETETGEEYIMFHNQDCCEHVYLEDVTGDLKDLIGSPIVRAEENGSDEEHDRPSPEKYPDSFTWTFYRIGTAKGTVVLRWYGSSNGYYSESVNFEKVS